MKIAIQEGLYRAADFRCFLADARKWGFDAVEVWGEGLAERLDDVCGAVKAAGMTVSSICPGGGGIRGSLLDGDVESAGRAADDIRSLLEAGARLGGAGLVLVPEFGARKFMALYPDHGDFERRKSIFIERLAPLAARAEQLGVRILLEPLNRYEAFFLLTVGQAADLCLAAAGPAVRIMADLFHMGIEENNVAGALARHAPLIAHVHLVDTNRLLPGLGERDFCGPLKALAINDFTGYLCIECGIAGDPDVVIPKSVEFIKGVIENL